MIEGTLTDPSSGGDIAFKPGDTPLLKSIFGIGSRPLRAYGCAHCGGVQLAVRFTDGDLERHQSFEGEQPSVVGEPGAGA